MVVEIILLVILLAVTGRGWKIGVIESLGELVGAVIAFEVGRYVSAWFGTTGVARFVVFVIVALIIAKLIGTLFHIAAKVLKIVTSLPLISLVNKILGGLLGLLSGIVLIGSTTYIVLFYRLDPTLMSWLGSSHVALWCESAFSSTLRFLL
ncbi:MAG TPA: CvpA family protein [Verrucomicrobiae bacterium]|nr:CvpA family protein [Verrucomicrobiae bacterium]